MYARTYWVQSNVKKYAQHATLWIGQKEQKTCMIQKAPLLSHLHTYKGWNNLMQQINAFQKKKTCLSTWKKQEVIGTLSIFHGQNNPSGQVIGRTIRHCSPCYSRPDPEMHPHPPRRCKPANGFGIHTVCIACLLCLIYFDIVWYSHI